MMQQNKQFAFLANGVGLSEKTCTNFQRGTRNPKLRWHFIYHMSICDRSGKKSQLSHSRDMLSVECVTYMHAS
jgi:hypothetical protein